jgi:LysM repeat protein
MVDCDVNGGKFLQDRSAVHASSSRYKSRFIFNDYPGITEQSRTSIQNWRIMVKRVKVWLVLILPLIFILAGCTRSLQETVPPEMPTNAVVISPDESARPDGGTDLPTPGDGAGQPAQEDSELGGDPGTLPEATAIPEPVPSDDIGGSTNPVESAIAPLEDVIHTITAGQTVGTIAQSYGVTIDEIAAANSLLDINRIYVGQELVIPLSTAGQEVEEVVDEAEDSAETAPETTPNPANDIIYYVRPGDNLFRIALNNGITVEELAAYNNIADPERIEVGQEIRIPQ